MAKKKVKKKCCRKYLKEGKHCKNCPLLVKAAPAEKEGKNKKSKKGKKKQRGKNSKKDKKK